ncbi:putative endo-beta-1,4-glucanase D [Calycina marina]|uniref:AA9 family lytic polysaccharide monooxygenase n=1 Tax=Calycina marina TaxID=1763456 RepID=A0A9P7YU38_9HELO|nr:putative endo-beta-1,4-glucanase D [Calycina marina]
MKFTATFASLALASTVLAHSTVTNIYVNDVNQGIGNSDAGYIRSPPSNDPVKDISSSDLTCNVNNVVTSETIQVVAGDKITFEWHHNEVSDSDDIIDSSHVGPVLAYIAPTSSNGAGDVWVKLAEDGFTDGVWAVTTLIANRGLHSLTLPETLAPGTYLLRPEIIALHEADVAYTADSARGAQLYMECVQIEVTSGGTTTLPTGVAIPGVYTETDPGIVFNIYDSFSSYPIPGPSVWDGAAEDTTTASTSTEASIPVTSSAAPVVSSALTKMPTTTLVTVVKPTSSSTTPASVIPAPAKTPSTTLATVVKPSTSLPSSTSGTVAMYYQCGGINYEGATTCVSGTFCKVLNPYYFQCLES